MQIMTQGYFYVFKILKNCDNYSSQSCFTLKIERTQQNYEHKDTTSIIIISDFSDFSGFFIDYTNYAKIDKILPKLQGN